LHQTEIEGFWQAYLFSLPETSPVPETYEAWSFGDKPETADELAALVLEGPKRATASLLWVYETEGETLPQAGDLSVILDGQGQPVCIIQTTQVDINPFNQVDADFAAAEGEGDRSLAYWRDVHWRFFSRECQTIGREPSLTMPVVCERFQLVYRPQDQSE
jgi:uncharacterized protein YhfF